MKGVPNHDATPLRLGVFSNCFTQLKPGKKIPLVPTIPITFPQALRNRALETSGIFFRCFNCYKTSLENTNDSRGEE